MKYFLALSLSLFYLVTSAAFLRNVPQDFKLPDGSTASCFASGDEFFHWLHDENNFTLSVGADGYLYYSVLKDNNIVCSNYRFKTINPAEVGLVPGVILPGSAYQSRKAQFSKTVKGLKSAPTTGTINNIVIFIKFSGDLEITNSMANYDNMFNNNSVGYNSMANYFKETSYNQLVINTGFYPSPSNGVLVSYTDNNPRNYYRPYNASTNTGGYQNSTEHRVREHEMLANAINAVKGQIPAGLNIDGNDDGFVDNICFVVKGAADGWSELLWPHMWSLTSNTVYINKKKVYSYNFQLEKSLGTVNVGVLCHEMFHSLGSPDLYHYDEAFDHLSPIGSWDLMCNNTNPPQQISSYMKYKYGKWITEIPVITKPGRYTLHPVADSKNCCYRIDIHGNNNEFLWVEYRKKAEPFDNTIPGSGLIIYRINSSYKGNANFNGSGTFDEVYAYRVDGDLVNNGEIDKSFFCKESGRTIFSDYSNPSDWLSTGEKAGIFISNISSAGETISFDFEGGNPNLAKNAGLKYLTEPVMGCLQTNPKIKVVVKNFGTSEISAENLKFGIQIANEKKIIDYTGKKLASGTEIIHEVVCPINMADFKKYPTKIYTLLDGDENHENDTIAFDAINGNLNYMAVNAKTLQRTYTDLGDNGVAIVTENKDNANSGAIEIGFPFSYNCQVFNTFVLNTNGFIRLGSESPSATDVFFQSANTVGNGPFNSLDNKDINLICPFNHDLISGTEGSEYKVYTSGMEGSRICVIQFKNLTEKTVNLAVQYSKMNFQIKLYEGSNVIEFCFGEWTVSGNSSAFKTAACGIKGSTNTNGQLLLVNKGSSYAWADATYFNQNYSTTATLNFGNPPERPAPVAGLIFRFFPNYLANTLSASNISSNQANLNAIVNATGLTSSSYFQIGETANSGLTYPIEDITGSGYTNKTVSYSVSGLLPNTRYFFRIVNVVGGKTYYGEYMSFTTLTTAIEEKNASKISAYPNPVLDVLYVDLSGYKAHNAVVQIINMVGKLVLAQDINGGNSGTANINVSKLFPGIYTLIIKNDKESFTHKFSKL
jgi:M6 family metalloprotease-like protein